MMSQFLPNFSCIKTSLSDNCTGGMAESQPLLQGESHASPGPSAPPPPSYSEIDETKQTAGQTAVGQDEQPPPYSPYSTGPTVTPHINCRVCQAHISLEGRQHLHVIKCTACNEATPIKNAPPGKKYVRCPCNCLLICSIDAVRIACPRENCRRMITLQSPVTQPRSYMGSSSPAGATIRATCAHCSQIFVFLKINIKHKLAICPHCSGRSSVGPQFIRRRALLFSIIGIIFLTAGIATTVVSFTGDAGYIGIYFVWIGAYIVGIANLMRAMFYGCVKVSIPIG